MFRARYASVFPIINSACFVSSVIELPTATLSYYTALLTATNSSPGHLFPPTPTGKCTTTFVNCFPRPTVMPWLLCIDSDLHIISVIALIEQHFFLHCHVKRGLGIQVFGLSGINFWSFGIDDSGKSTITYIMLSSLPFLSPS